MVADLHALTVRQEPKEFRERCLSFSRNICLRFGSGKNVIFFQSHSSACGADLGSQLHYPRGQLNRMTQLGKNPNTPKRSTAGYTRIPCSWLRTSYYQADLVPVGRSKAALGAYAGSGGSFNKKYGVAFKVQVPIPKLGARIMSLQDPSKKCQVRRGSNTFVALLVRRKIRKNQIRGDRFRSTGARDLRYGKQSRVSNLMTIYSAFTGKTRRD